MVPSPEPSLRAGSQPEMTSRARLGQGYLGRTLNYLPKTPVKIPANPLRDAWDGHGSEPLGYVWDLVSTTQVMWLQICMWSPQLSTTWPLRVRPPATARGLGMTPEESGGSWENRSSPSVPPTATPEVSLALQLSALGGSHGLGHRRMTTEATSGFSYLSVRPFPSPEEPNWPQTGLQLLSSSWLFHRG